jgi:hypothetical protein
VISVNQMGSAPETETNKIHRVRRRILTGCIVLVLGILLLWAMSPEVGALVVGIGVFYLSLIVIEYAATSVPNRLWGIGIKVVGISLAVAASCLVVYLFYLLPAHMSCWPVQKAAAALIDNIDAKVKVLGRPPEDISEALAAMNATAIDQIDYLRTETEYAILFRAVLIKYFYRVSTLYSSRLKSWKIKIDPRHPVQPDFVPVSRRHYFRNTETGGWSSSP